MREKKNLSVRRKKISKCEEGKKNVSVECRVFGKKKNWKKSSEREKSKYFGVEILLSSCSLVDLGVKVMGENDENFRVFFSWMF